MGLQDRDYVRDRHDQPNKSDHGNGDSTTTRNDNRLIALALTAAIGAAAGGYMLSSDESSAQCDFAEAYELIRLSNFPNVKADDVEFVFPATISNKIVQDTEQSICTVNLKMKAPPDASGGATQWFLVRYRVTVSSGQRLVETTDISESSPVIDTSGAEL